MVKCWMCDTDIKDGFRSEEFLYHLEHEHVKLQIGASKNDSD